MERERRLIDDAREAFPAVVQILAEGYDGNNLQSLLDPRFLVPAEWAGSGFFIEVQGERGYILTNSHVVSNARKLKIKTFLTSEELFTVELVGNVRRGDPDIALLRLPEAEQARFQEIAGGALPALQLGDSSEVQRGARIKAIGYPYGLPEPNISAGEISSFLPADAYTSERIVTDAAINPGNSGGPAIVRGGHVIGINTAVISGADNIAFITPINFFDILQESFLSGNEPELTSLGGRFQPSSAALARHFGQGRAEGLIVTRLVPGSMLEKAGVQRGDILVSLNGLAIDRYGTAPSARIDRKVNIIDITHELRLGQEVKLEVIRGGERQEITATAAPIPVFGIRSQPTIQHRRYLSCGGLILQELSYELVDGLSDLIEEDYWKRIEASQYTLDPLIIVTKIDSDTQADDLFLEYGEVLTTVAGESFNGNLEALAKRLAGIKDNGTDELLLEFRSGSYGCFDLNSGFDALEVKSCQQD